MHASGMCERGNLINAANSPSLKEAHGLKTDVLRGKEYLSGESIHTNAFANTEPTMIQI